MAGAVWCMVAQCRCAQVTLALRRRPDVPRASNMSREAYMEAVAQVKEHIQAGDVFQLVLSHRFRRRTFADPFEVYRCVDEWLKCAYFL